MKRIIAAAAVVVLASGLSSCSSLNRHKEICTVTDKDRVSDGSGGSEMRVYTDCGTFVIDDNFVAGFNSADRYAQLTPGKRYEIESGGYRSGFWSMFPSILDAKEVK